MICLFWPQITESRWSRFASAFSPCFLSLPCRFRMASMMGAMGGAMNEAAKKAVVELSPHPTHPLSWGPQREHQWGWRLEDGWWLGGDSYTVILLYSHLAWHALAKSSASFSSPYDLMAISGAKTPYFLDEPISTFRCPQTRNLSGNPLEDQEETLNFDGKKAPGFLQIFRKPIHWSWWFPRPEPTPMVPSFRQETQTASGHLVDVGLSCQNWSVCHHFALWTWQKLQLYHLSWD